MVRRRILWRWVSVRPVADDEARACVASTDAWRAAMQDEMRKLAVEHYSVGKVTLYERGGAMGYVCCRQETACPTLWRVQLQSTL